MMMHAVMAKLVLYMSSCYGAPCIDNVRIEFSVFPPPETEFIFFFGLPGGHLTTGGCMMKSSVLNGGFSIVGIGVMLEVHVERYSDTW